LITRQIGINEAGTFNCCELLEANKSQQPRRFSWYRGCFLKVTGKSDAESSKEDLPVKRINISRALRAIILALGLTILPLATTAYAQSNDNNNRASDRRGEDRDRRNRERDDNEFPWGLLGLAGLLGLLGLRKPKRDIYVDERNAPPPPRDVPPPRR
jgi:MYXO-CTERM domain-containing protein